LVEALCYKPEESGVESRRGGLFFSIYLILPAALRLWRRLSGDRRVRLTILPSSVSVSQPYGPSQPVTGTALNLYYVQLSNYCINRKDGEGSVCHFILDSLPEFTSGD
jgi:hypothetical protein